MRLDLRHTALRSTRSSLRRVALVTCVVLGACASQPRPGIATAEPGTATRITEEPSFEALLRAEGFTGSIAVLGPDSAGIRCSDRVDCETRSVPASTFKIANSIIALETGVAPDASLVIPWDGIDRDVPDWNHDLDMRGAFTVSSVPYYQEIARRIGPERMRDWVTRLDYGNHDTGAVVDEFWLRGPLTISPIEQLAFLARFESGALPISDRTRTIVRDLMFREERGGATFRGKTGWGSPGQPDERGWFVGYATRDGESTFVAVRLRRDPAVPSDRFLEARPRIARAALESIGAF